MSEHTLTILLFILTILPLYYSAFAVEKYFTNFHTAYWNIYGLAVNLIAASFVIDSILPFLVGLIIIVILIFVFDDMDDMLSGKVSKVIRLEMIYEKEFQVNISNAVRSLGSAFICINVSWFIIILTISNFILAEIITIMHAIILWIVIKEYNEFYTILHDIIVGRFFE